MRFLDAIGCPTLGLLARRLNSGRPLAAPCHKQFAPALFARAETGQRLIGVIFKTGEVEKLPNNGIERRSGISGCWNDGNAASCVAAVSASARANRGLGPE